MEDARADAAPIGVKEHYRRLGVGLRRPHNWFEAFRFCVVGASGYVVNLAVFYLLDARMPYLLGFTIAFVVAASSNFVWNRLWTFRVHHGVPHVQYARFLSVSALALAIDLGVLSGLVEGAGMGHVPAAAVAILIATPVSFVGNKFWSFR